MNLNDRIYKASLDVEWHTGIPLPVWLLGLTVLLATAAILVALLL